MTDADRILTASRRAEDVNAALRPALVLFVEGAIFRR
jgi:hypothetical protein